MNRMQFQGYQRHKDKSMCMVAVRMEEGLKSSVKDLH